MPNLEYKHTKIYQQCLLVYDQMAIESDGSVIDHKHIRVWKGKITILCQQVGVPNGAYGKVMNTLTYLNCITVLTVGRVGTLTEIALHQSPESVEWRTMPSQKDLTPRVNHATIEQQLRDLHESLSGLHVKDAIITLEQRIEKIEDALKELQEQ